MACPCDNHPDPDPDVQQVEEMMDYEDMHAAYERFGDYAKAYWTTHRCHNCSEEITSPKYAVLTEDKQHVLCLECRTRMAQDAFFAKVWPELAA